MTGRKRFIPTSFGYSMEEGAVLQSFLLGLIIDVGLGDVNENQERFRISVSEETGLTLRISMV
jgi:hypothetical protein